MSTRSHAQYASEDIRRAARLIGARAFIAIVLMTVVTACSHQATPTSPDTTSDTTTTTVTTTQDSPAVTLLSPTSGSADGGTTVTITGTGFTNVSTVTFGGNAAAAYSVDSDTSITAITPAVAAGAVDVIVTTAGGASAASQADWFEFAANTLTGLSFSSASVAAGLPMRGSVSVTFPAPSKGIRIPLTWSTSPSGSGAALYPLTVSIPAGATSGSFQVTTFFVSSSVTVQLSAEYGGQTRTASFVIGP